MLPTHFADFLTAIGKLGPVHTARHPLIEYWMSGKFFLLFGIFSLKTENHVLGEKFLQKILRRAFLICYFLSCAASILKKAGCISCGWC